MIPVSNNNSPCSPISSNCVIWQGPNIPCVNICNGDTVSDVVGKLGDELCTLIDTVCQCNPDLSGLNLNCLPSTPLEVEPVLQTIIDYVCSLPTTPGDLPDINLPACLQYNDPLGNPVTELPLDQFAVLLGNEICDILSQITIINNSISSIESRLTILENCVLPCTPSTGGDVDVISSCLFPATSVPASTLLLALESQFCSFRNAVGSIALINSAISAQCVFSATARLSGSGNYGSVAGWVDFPATLAETTVNQWLVICDLYNAVKYIQDNCCGSSGCGAVNFDYSYSAIDTDADSVVDTINLNFTGSTIPSGWTDCGGSTTVTFTDSLGSSFTQNINVTSLSINPAGINIDVSSLLTTNNLTVKIEFCATDGVSQCADTETFTIPLSVPCPSPITLTPGFGDFTVSFANALGTSAVYTITAVNTSTGIALATAVITNPGLIVNYTFTGATPGITYDVIVTTSQGTQVITCPPESVTLPFITVYEALICQTGLTETIGWLDTGTTPSIGEFWSFTDPVAGVICGKITNVIPLTTPTYTTGVSVPTLINGCEDCGTVWRVLNCEDGIIYNVDSTGWLNLLPLEPGQVTRVTNDGATFGGWTSGETNCVELIRLTTDPADITASSLLDGIIFVDCPTCIGTPP